MHEKHALEQQENKNRNQGKIRSNMNLETQHTKIYGCCKISSKREVYSYKFIYQEKREISKSLKLHFKELEKQKQTKPKVSRKQDKIE